MKPGHEMAFRRSFYVFYPCLMTGFVGFVHSWGGSYL